MTIHLSRRDSVKHASPDRSLAGGTRAADTFVVADTTAGKVRGVEVEASRSSRASGMARTRLARTGLPPAPVPKWTGVRDAPRHGPSAPQTETGARQRVGSRRPARAAAEGEDCLSNV